MLRMAIAVTAAGLILQAGLALAQPADTSTEFDCLENSGCSSTKEVYPGTTASFFGSCNGATPASQACTAGHPAVICKNGPPTGAGQASCRCTNPTTFENVVKVTAKVTCQQPN